MRGRILLPLAVLVVLAAPVTSQQPARPAPINIPVARKAVVTIQALDASGQLMASGTGFFVTEGYVVTAAHVLEDAAGCRIEMSDGQRQRCSVAAADTAKDVAMLMVSGSPPSTLRWGSSESMKDGDEVTVISNPLGQLPGTVSRGIISASRVVNGTKLLQISAAISHGSSGAPVLNARGQVIGIVRSTIEAGQSLNFATATDAIRNLNNDQVAVAEGAALLTPKNIVSTAGNSGSRASMGTPVSLPQISIGQTINGNLSGSDSLYPDTTYYKMYQFTTTPGQEITIDLSSSDFDPVLIVRGEGLAQSIVDDDGGPACSSRVSQAFLGRGPYRILVNTTASPHRQTGRFALAISEGSQHVQGRSENDCSPAGSGPQSTAAVTSIRVGETVNGSLTSSDSLYPDNSYFKFYQFTAPAGRPVTIDLSSDDFDPVLIIRGSDLRNSIINDDGGPGCYARVSRTFPSTGPYRILVNTTSTPERQTGRFSLSITDGSKPVQDSAAATADCQTASTAGSASSSSSSGGSGGEHGIDVGQTQQGTLTRNDVLLEHDSTYAQAWTIQGRANQTITIDLESDAFDSYLFLRGPGIEGGRDFQDDDSGGNCHARLTAMFPQSGEYEIVVNTAGQHYATGAFTLSVTSGSKPKSVAQCRRN